MHTYNTHTHNNMHILHMQTHTHNMHTCIHIHTHKYSRVPCQTQQVTKQRKIRRKRMEKWRQAKR